MTIIHSFLQKKKMREFSHGIFMVFAAYVLSILLLVIGSDTLYNIKSKADGLNEPIPKQNEDIIDPYDTSYSMQESYQEYQKDIQEAVSVSDDTNWLMGYAMGNEEYGRMLDQMDQNDAFIEIEAKTISSFSTSEAVKDKSHGTIAATKEERKMLEQIVEAEATGEDIIGKILVANVILNRTLDEEFPDTVKEVIFQKVGDDYQFSPIADKRYWKVKVTDETKEAVQRAMNGEDNSEGALYFMARKLARKSSAKWFDNNLKWLFKHGGHEFFR